MFSRFDPNFTICSETEENGLTCITVECESNPKPQCPFTTMSARKTHHVSKYGSKKPMREIYDIMGNKPVKLIVASAKRWQCADCSKIFDDPALDIYRQRISSLEFDEWLAQQVINGIRHSTEESSIRAIASKMNFSESFVRGTLHQYASNCFAKKKTQVDCARIWLLPYEYDKEMRIVAFGEKVSSKQIVLIGVTRAYDFKEFIDLFGEIKPPAGQTIICPGDLPRSSDRRKYRFYELPEDWLFDYCPDNWPKEIEKIMIIIDRLHKRNFSFDTMVLLIPFCNEFWKNVIVQSGQGPYIYHTDGNSHPHSHEGYNADDYIVSQAVIEEFKHLLDIEEI